MCHTVIAQRMCEVCHRGLGETVIDFTRCARKCSSPFYCLTPKPEMETCEMCSATTNSSGIPTPVLARSSVDEYPLSDAVAAAAACHRP